MKIRMTNSYHTIEVYDTIEINPSDYDELRNLSEDEVIEYLNENGFDFKLNDNNQENIVDEVRFEKDIVREKTSDEEFKFSLVTE